MFCCNRILPKTYPEKYTLKYKRKIQIYLHLDINAVYSIIFISKPGKTG